MKDIIKKTRIEKLEMIINEFEDIDLKDIKRLKKLSINIYYFQNNYAYYTYIIEMTKLFYKNINEVIEKLENKTTSDLTEDLDCLDNYIWTFKRILKCLKENNI